MKQYPPNKRIQKRMKSTQWSWKLFYQKGSIRNVLFLSNKMRVINLMITAMKHIQSTESQQSWSDDHVSVSSNDYQTSSKINKTETSKSSDDMEKDHGKTQNQPWPMLTSNMTFRIQRNIVIFDKTRRNRVWAINNKSIPDCWRKCRRIGYNWRWWRKCKSFTYSNC